METKKESKSRNRGVALDGERVAKYRHAMGFTQEELAVKIGAADPKTVQRIEAGEPTTFLDKLAKALGVHATQLIPDLPTCVDPPQSNQAEERMRISVFLDVPLEMLPVFKREPLAGKLWLFCQMQGIVRDGAPNITIEFGSIIISADLTKADVLRMMEAFMAGELSYLGVANISCANIESTAIAKIKTQTQDVSSQEVLPNKDPGSESAYQQSSDYALLEINKAILWLNALKEYCIDALPRTWGQDDDDQSLKESLFRIKGIIETAIDRICDAPIPLRFHMRDRISLSLDMRFHTYIFSFPNKPSSTVCNLLSEKKYSPVEEGRTWKKKLSVFRISYLTKMEWDDIVDEFVLYETICAMPQSDPVQSFSPV